MAKNLVVIGGGAAGFFSAITAAETNKNAKITILEKTSKFLSKVKVSGGGRCNVTHNSLLHHKLSENYPRGNKELKSLFKRFHSGNTVEWFKSRGVLLKTEADGRMFPASDNSQTIIDCFLKETSRLNIELKLNQAVLDIKKDDEGLSIHTSSEILKADSVLIATGGNANFSTYLLAASLGHKIENLIPSLFTFNDTNKYFKDLSGISVPEAQIRIAGSKFTQTGPLLITHWGLSGPAVIKLSAWAAIALHSSNYKFTALVSWIGSVDEDTTRTLLLQFKNANHLKRIYIHPLFGLPQRLWNRLCEIAEITESKIWADISTKSLNKLLENLIRCPFEIKGKTTFKEEFVTCGGINLAEINLETMESKLVPGLYFAGEVLNIDGITGGFNFQSAWTTGWLAGKGMAG